MARQNEAPRQGGGRHHSGGIPSHGARWEEMLALAQEMIWQCYLNPQSEDLMPEVDSFPDIRYLTGNYDVGDVSYGCVHRDQRHQSCEVKEGRLRHKYHDGNAWRSERLPLDSPEIPRYYRVILHLRLTGDERGKEEDSMGLDLLAEFVKLDDPFDFEILSYDVI